MKTGKIVLAVVVTSVLKIIWGFLTCGWLFNWIYQLEPTVLWKKQAEIPLVLMNVTEFIFVFLLVFVYVLMQKGLPGKGVAKGLTFGLCVWLVGSLPGISMMGMCTVMAPAAAVYLLINSFLASLWQGALIAVIYRE